MLKRAAIKVRPDLLIVQGPLGSLKISYGRIYSATSVRLELHHPYKSLSGWQKGTFRPLYQETCVLIDLSQDIEVARGGWITRREARLKGDTRSLAAKVMSLKE